MKNINVEYQVSERESRTVEAIDWKVHDTWDEDRPGNIEFNPPIDEKKADIALIKLKDPIRDQIRYATLPEPDERIKVQEKVHFAGYGSSHGGKIGELTRKEASTSCPYCTAG